MRCLSPELSYSEDYSIIYDQAEEVGAYIQKKIGGATVHVDPTTLFELPFGSIKTLLLGQHELRFLVQR